MARHHVGTHYTAVEPMITYDRDALIDVMVYHWRKDISGLKEAYAELHRPKVGRKARLSGETEEVVDTPSLFGHETMDI